MKPLFVILIFLGVLLMWFLCGYLLYDNTAGRGTFGDMFGAVNALFSGLAFAGIIIALFFQKKELELQRGELAQTREELKGQKEQLKIQNTVFREQAFQTMFFQMLSFHNEIVNSMVFKQDPGRKNFDYIYAQFKRSFEGQLKQSNVVGETNLVQFIAAQFDSFLLSYQSNIGHYFKHLCNILDFVDNNKYSNEEECFNIIKSLLSTSELCLLFYYSLSRSGRPKIGKYVINFKLLEGLVFNLLIAEHHKRAYTSITYGINEPSWPLLGEN